MSHTHPRRAQRRLLRRFLGVLVAGLVLVSALPGAGTAAPAAVVGKPDPRAFDTAKSGGYDETRSMTRDYWRSGVQESDTRDVRVKVDRTSGLLARQRVRVSWSGAHPSGGRAANPFGENGLNQEYPVMVLQCRGVDSATAPAAEQLSPETCWTNTWLERTMKEATTNAVWTKDSYADPSERGQVSGVDALPADCSVSATQAIHVTRFVTRKGKTFSGCSEASMPPEAAVGAADPPNEVAGFTALDGTGSVDFEVRTDAENASLGCTATVACSLVVVPIMGITCTDQSRQCNKTGVFEPGATNYNGDVAPDLAVSSKVWWAASNWRNRFTVPLGFAKPPSLCSVLGTGEPVPFYGSALLDQVALQWAPAYCLNKKRFNWQASSMSDDAAYALMTSGDSVAAEVTGPRDLASTDPVAFAPTAVSGFGISFVIDKPDARGQATSLKLNARLLAKLLTESYPGSEVGTHRPGLEKNPLSLNLDPEFKKLNPGLDTTHDSEAGAVLLALSTSSDVILSLTRYIAADPDAMSFVNGDKDPWSMTVNPAYKGLALPVSTWPLLDTWVPDIQGRACLKANPSPYLPKVAAPVSELDQITSALVQSWPNVQTVCDKDVAASDSSGRDVWKLGRIAPQGLGTRFMLGLVSLGDAARYGLPVASLQAAPGAYVAPNARSLTAAVDLAAQETPTGAFSMDQTLVRGSRSAYPGMLIVQTAARTAGMKADDAANVSSFIDISTTEGQRPGTGNGQLPDGYLPIIASGPTGKLLEAAKRSSAAIRAQKGLPSTGGSGTGAAGGGASGTPAGSQPDGAAAAAAPKSATVDDATTLASKTIGTESPLGGLLLPGLLVLGMVGAAVSVVSKVAARTRGGVQ